MKIIQQTRFLFQSSWLQLMVFAILLVLTLSPGPTLAQTVPEPGINISSVVGLDGYCKYDSWMPVRVNLENTGTDFEGRVQARIVDGLNQWNYAQEVSLPSVSRKEVTIYVFLSGGANNITTSFSTNKGIVAQTSQNFNCVQTNSNLVGVWASTPSVYNIFTTLSFSGGRTSVAQLELADIPAHPEGIEMLNMLIISDMDTGSLSDAQKNSLSSWVENGGRLIVVGGPGWQKTVAGIEDLLPIQVQSSVTIPALDGLEWFSPESEKLIGEAVIAVGESKTSAVVLARQENNPVVLRHKLGFGDVYFLAADPALAPLRSWSGIEQLYQFIFAAPQDIPAWANGFSSWSEASSAISNVPGLGLPSIFLICGFLILYVFALGPINYLVLRQLKRRELAWISIPVLVLMFSLAAWILGSFARGLQPITNHLAIVQVFPDRDRANVHGLVGVFSPNRSQYNIKTEGSFLAYPILQNSFGSANSWQFLQTVGGALAENVRIDVGGIEGMAISGQVPAPQFSSDISMDLNGVTLSIRGYIENLSQLSLRDAVILGPGQVQNIGDFNPGDRLPINLDFPSTGNASVGSHTNPIPSYGYDNTLDEFFGTSYIYGTSDQDLARRFNLLQSAMGYNGGRGGGIYLMGWTDSSPLHVNLDGKRFRAEHTAIYIVALTPALQQGDTSSLTLPPAMFTWSSIENSSYSDASPYSAYLYDGTYSFRFQLSQAIPYKNVESLTLHLTSYGNSGQTSLIISLWDFSLSEWVTVPVETWGDHNIDQPERYVGPTGEVRLQIENPFQTTIDVERSDFTLVVKQ